jgi:hypothetical protein
MIPRATVVRYLCRAFETAARKRKERGHNRKSTSVAPVSALRGTASSEKGDCVGSC